MKKSIVAIALTTLAAAAQAGVLILGAPSSSSWNNDVRAKIQGTGLVSGAVDIFNVSSGTPTLATLSAYDAVLVYSDTSYSNNVALGNVLADFVDSGGGVVEMTFSNYAPSAGLGLSGRFVTGNYDVFTNAAGQGSCGDLGTVVNPAHALFAGVASFDGGGSAYCNTGISVKSGAQALAFWTNGEEFAAIRTDHAAAVLGLNFYAPSSSVRPDFWNASTDGAKLMANALNIASGSQNSNQVPEPSSLLLVAAAGVVAIGARRRRQQSV